MTRVVLRRQIPLIALAGCSACPAQNLLGCYFPGWMVAAIAGVIAVVVLRQALVAAGVEKHLLAPPLTYLCPAVAGTLAASLAWLGN